MHCSCPSTSVQQMSGRSIVVAGRYRQGGNHYGLGEWRLLAWIEAGEAGVRRHTGTESWGGHGNWGSRSCGSSRSDSSRNGSSRNGSSRNGSSRNGGTTDSIQAFALLNGQTACALPACQPLHRPQPQYYPVLLHLQLVIIQYEDILTKKHPPSAIPPVDALLPE